MSNGLKMCITAALFAGSQMLTPTLVFGAGEHGTEAEAQEMVKKAVAAVKSLGPEKAYKAFTEHPDGAFKDRDLYVFAYDFQGNCLAQGANAKMVGVNLIDMKDLNGTPLIASMINVVKTKKAGWFGPYVFSNPVTKKMESKKSYCEQGAGETIVCVGIYLGS